MIRKRNIHSVAILIISIIFLFIYSLSTAEDVSTIRVFYADSCITDLGLYIQSIKSAILNNESEEHLKNITNSFLKICFYQNNRFGINTYKRADSAITCDGVLYAIIEMKKPTNRSEMTREDDINRKALWELVFYYLSETRIVSGPHVKRNFNSEIRRLIITDAKSWFLINAQDLDKICQGYLEKLFFKFENHQLTYSDVDTFYLATQEYFNQINITEQLRYTYFEMEDVYSKRNQWQYLLKVLRKDYLLRDGYKQISKTHILNKNFYQELLYLMGLKESKEDGKNVIKIDHDIQNSFADQVYSILRFDKEKPEDEATEETFELVLIWINRMLFIKLFEGQLIAFNGDDPKYHILDNEKIHAFDELQVLFFDVLGKKERNNTAFLHQFESIPYLNSSLFERYDIERQDVNIREIRNNPIAKKSGSALGKRAPEQIPLLEYVISFLNAYSFTALNSNETDRPQSSTEIIDASVLGLIFEKINGYKEGSFYTKGFVTEYICQETIENAVIEKLNHELNWHCSSVDDLKFSIDTTSSSQIRQINDIINSLHICDPAVGSGHFLVSALNRIIALKRELGVLMKYGSASPLREYSDIKRTTLIDYKAAVKRYHSESDKSEKARLKQLINTIRSNLHAACAQIRYSVDENNQINLTDDLEWSINRYENAFEWAIEFPEVISEEGVFLGFDCIIGNPPYIRVQELQHEDIDYYKKKYSTAWKRIDISTLFIELGYNLVRSDGFVSYITSNQFLTAEYGRRIRDYIYQKRFATKMVDFADLAVFDGALTYVSIFYFKKARANASFLYYRVPSLPFIAPTLESWSIVPYSELDGAEEWNFERIQLADSDEQVIDFKSVIAEVERVTKAELDFRVEAENTRLFKEKCIDDEEQISCPTVIDGLTTERIFTMTYIDGCSVANTEKLVAEGYDLDEIGRVIVDSYLHQVLDVGTFHADPHQGNILVSHGKPYWIDFGMIGHVTDKDIDLIQDAVKALLIQDADALVNAVMGMGAASEKTDRTRLTRDAEVFIQKYMNVKSVSDINVTEVFDEVMSLAAQNHVSMPGRFTMLARSLTTLEGVIEQLCPDLNLFDILYDKLKERARQNMNIPRELLEKGQELVNAGKKAAKIPLLASEVLEGMVKGKTKVRFELSGYEEPLNRIFHFLRYTVLTLVALVLFIGSCILCTTDFKPILANGVPLLAVAGIIFSIALAIYSIKKLK